MPRDDLELLQAAHRRGFYGASRKGPGEALLTDPAAPFLQRFRARVPLYFPCPWASWQALHGSKLTLYYIGHVWRQPQGQLGEALLTSPAAPSAALSRRTRCLGADAVVHVLLGSIKNRHPKLH